MKKLRILELSLFSLCLMLLISCNSNSSNTAKVTLEGFEISDLGNGSQHAVKYTTDGKVSEEGHLLNGQKNGAWTTYHDDGKPKMIYNYINGKMNGNYLEFSNRGQLNIFAGYKNDQFHGLYSKYKFGRPLQETMYNDGKIDGFHKEYGSDGKIQKEMAFKDGKQHGKMRFYDTEGNITIEYDYENGEKVGGGMK